MDLATEQQKSQPHRSSCSISKSDTYFDFNGEDGCKADESSQVRAELGTEFLRRCRGHLCFKSCTGERTAASERHVQEQKASFNAFQPTALPQCIPLDL